MTISTTRTTDFSIESLRAAVQGRVIGPDDPDYDQARTVVYAGPERRPLAIVRVVDADDVARVIAFARDAALELGVKSGGHSATGDCIVDGGLVIDVHDLRDLDIDVAGRTAWAGSGLTAGEYSTAAAEHGLATGFGDTGSVGLGGLTTGGGVGYLGR